MIASELAIATSNLTKQFERHIAVNKLELEVQPGEVYGLIGPNGAGKTTLMRMLAAVEEPTTGEIHIYGDRLLTDNSHPRLKQKLGYLPDDFPLYEDLNVWDYLDYFARLYHLRLPHRRRRIQEVLELVQLTSKKNSNIKTLSRGMKQRLSLARTILHDPLLLLLDEPVSGLDPIARMQFREVIRILQSVGMTVLISSHVLSDLAELCTSVGIMELGSLVESTSLKDLYERLSHQQIIIKTLGDLNQLQQELKGFPNVEEWEIISHQNSLRVNFAGGDEESAKLLKHLIHKEIPIAEFHCTQEDLESIFLNLDHKQAS
ncbi:ABC transporter ATP-binding protein [Crocosphaera chwakensis]|uniref:ABC transporter ATP-binding protein n=1 Tax=Crocosphaera chwakensis CCY0110 TaxID=391612 RepID=A3INC4_9CHRO|nr:ABC transporter ATP-binding protein [Crocosphaera chwakensis]EAZ92101.1 ABC transporter ATP-binding protein [Crocosphaera chwakensis CCY0110]